MERNWSELTRICVFWALGAMRVASYRSQESSPSNDSVISELCIEVPGGRRLGVGCYTKASFALGDTANACWSFAIAGMISASSVWLLHAFMTL